MASLRLIKIFNSRNRTVHKYKIFVIELLIKKPGINFYKIILKTKNVSSLLIIFVILAGSK